MYKLSLLLLLVLVGSTAAGAAEAITPPAAHRLVVAGQAILIDVREPAEWTDGVAAPARLLPLSDLRGERDQWSETLAEAKAQQKTLILYCRTGNRSGQAAALLEQEGFRVANAGGFAAWRDAELPVRKP